MLETYKSNLQKEYNFELEIPLILAPGILMIFLDEVNFPRNLQRLT